MKKVVTVILRDKLGSLEFEITSWKIQEGCVIFTGVNLHEQSVYPLSSIVCFYNKVIE